MLSPGTVLPRRSVQLLARGPEQDFVDVHLPKPAHGADDRPCEWMGQGSPKEERWHLIDGCAVMMSPPNLADRRIALNPCELLNRSFAAQGSDLCAYHEIAIRVPGVVNFQPEPEAEIVARQIELAGGRRVRARYLRAARGSREPGSDRF